MNQTYPSSDEVSEHEFSEKKGQEMQRDVAGTVTEVERWKKMAEEHEIAAKQLARAAKEMKMQVSDARQQCEAMEDRLLALKMEAGAQISLLEDELNQTRETLRVKNAEAERLRDTCITKIRSLEDELNETRETVRVKNAEIERLKDLASAKMSLLEDELDEARDNLVVKDAEVRLLEDELNKTRDTLLLKDAEAERLKDQFLALKDEVNAKMSLLEDELNETRDTPQVKNGEANKEPVEKRNMEELLKLQDDMVLELDVMKRDMEAEAVLIKSLLEENSRLTNDIMQANRKANELEAELKGQTEGSTVKVQGQERIVQVPGPERIVYTERMQANRKVDELEPELTVQELTGLLNRSRADCIDLERKLEVAKSELLDQPKKAEFERLQAICDRQSKWILETERQPKVVAHVSNFLDTDPLPRLAAVQLEKPKRKLGMLINKHGGIFIVTSIIKGSYAAEAHPKIHEGDKLLAVNGNEVSLSDKVPLDEVIALIQGASSQGVVKLKLQHGDTSYETELRLDPVRDATSSAPSMAYSTATYSAPPLAYSPARDLPTMKTSPVNVSFPKAPANVFYSADTRNDRADSVRHEKGQEMKAYAQEQARLKAIYQQQQQRQVEEEKGEKGTEQGRQLDENKNHISLSDQGIPAVVRIRVAYPEGANEHSLMSSQEEETLFASQKVRNLLAEAGFPGFEPSRGASLEKNIREQSNISRTVHTPVFITSHQDPRSPPGLTVKTTLDPSSPYRAGPSTAIYGPGATHSRTDQTIPATVMIRAAFPNSPNALTSSLQGKFSPGTTIHESEGGTPKELKGSVWT